MADDDEQGGAELTSVTFASLHRPDSLAIPATLRRPRQAARPSAAVVIVHGSAGPDSRGPFYAQALNQAGVATLEIDMWTPRGVKSPLERPKSIQSTLPDAFGAFQFLASDPAIDAARIGIMGFSWGGVVSMLTATRPYAAALGEGARFAAHAPLYPVCWLYNQLPGFEMTDFTGAPIFIQCGELDAYDLPDSGETLARSLTAVAPGLVTVTTYPGATHAFDRTEPAMTATDPMARLGKGGEVLFAPNPEVAAQARAATVAFFSRVFAA